MCFISNCRTRVFLYLFRYSSSPNSETNSQTARTKTPARKNATQISQTPSPPSSPIPSPNNQPRPSKSPEKSSETNQSPESKLDQPSQTISDHMQTQNEPDHVSDSLSERSENILTNEDVDQTQTETLNDDGIITPDTTIVVPSQAETPPVYVKIRRSARILSGVGTGRKIVKDNTVHIIDDDDDDSEKTLSIQPADDLIGDEEVGAVTSTKSAPTKPKSKPSPASTKKSPTPKAAKGKEKVTSIGKEKAVSDGKEKKKVKTKFIPIPLVHPDDRENFEKYLKIKPVPTGRIFYFEELEKKGMDIRKYVEPLGLTDFFKIKDSVLPQLVQAFYHNANVHSDKNLIISNIRGVEIQLDTETLGCLINLPFEGVTIYGGDWYSKLGVSKEALIMELFNEEGGKLEDPTSSYLKKEFKILHNMLLHCIFPRIGSKQKKIALPYGMILTKLFRLFEVDETNQRVDNSCTVFGLKNVHHMKKENFSEEYVNLGKRKREVFEKDSQVLEKDGLEMLSDALGEQPENVLPNGTSADTNVGLNTESIPSHLSTSLNFGTPFSHGFKVVPPRSGKNLAAFYSTTNPQNTTVF
ncbi:hypothetical protein P8452_02989 [Trifolium repens]|nr:hypothetical protein P8452_02989 [Trifolium repens]